MACNVDFWISVVREILFVVFSDKKIDNIVVVFVRQTFNFEEFID